VKNNNSSSTRKVLVSFMALAFFYLVIGDLILIHQKAIFKYDIFADNPMSKPDKSGKDKIYKLKDKKNRVSVNLITFVSGEIKYSTSEICTGYFTFQRPNNSFQLVDCKYSPISFRGPPTKAFLT
jgi:hypothetical protein